MMAIPALIKAYSQYGAQMGRTSHGDANTCDKLYLHYLPKDSGGYDSGGAYWGYNPDGLRLYRAVSEGGWTELFYDARNREDAKQRIKADFPGAKFIR